MRHEWDEAKRRQNLAKHGMDCLGAVPVLESPTLLVIADTQTRINDALREWIAEHGEP